MIRVKGRKNKINERRKGTFSLFFLGGRGEGSSEVECSSYLDNQDIYVAYKSRYTNQSGCEKITRKGDAVQWRERERLFSS